MNEKHHSLDSNGLKSINSRAAIAASFLIIALSIAYYFVIFLPGKEKSEQAMQLQKVTSQQLVEEGNKQIYNQCGKSAEEAATKLLKSKAELLPAGAERSTLEKAAEKKMFYKDDYNTYFEKCLKRHGILE